MDQDYIHSEFVEAAGTRQVFKAHRLVYHSTLGWRVIKKKKQKHQAGLCQSPLLSE